MKNWKDLEALVRQVASYIWLSPAEAEEINGVKADCVLRLKPDYWIVIEITKEETLAKLREDLAKFSSVRPYLFSKSIYCECYFVCENDPPPSLIETGRGVLVNVMSVSTFKKQFFDYGSYHYLRSQKRFGSAVDPFSGEKDDTDYVPVEYLNSSALRVYSLDDIVSLLLKNVKIILLGNYGTGKSRCVQEIFSRLRTYADSGLMFPLSIDLRDNWGARRGHEIIRRHFDDLGFSKGADGIIRIFDQRSVCLLLDGFDEIGSQAWSDNPNRLKDIRADSLLGVKDLLINSRGGALITGREHYFNSDEEMFECLGLNPHATIVLECPEEFSDEQMQQYLKMISPSLALPEWLPRRPLICQLIGRLGEDLLDALVDEKHGEVQFWRSLIDAICRREARINPALDHQTIKSVLVHVARLTRSKPGDVGPISIMEINKAFEKVVGSPAVDESAIMLQRLPTLGRVAAETTERQFMDFYILDGLRAEDVIQSVRAQTGDTLDEPWLNPLREFGLKLVAEEIGRGFKNLYLSFAHKASRHDNKIITGDIIASLFVSGVKDLDFGGLFLRDSHVSLLDMTDAVVKDLSIEDSFLDALDVSGAQPSGVKIVGCEIKLVLGVSAAEGLPEWVKRNNIKAFESVATVKRIREAHLSDSERIFVTIIKKTFFQPGAGRKEQALLRGLGESADKRLANRILNMLVSDEILYRSNGDEGWVYIPNRQYTRRMKRILAELTFSDDPIWAKLNPF